MKRILLLAVLISIALSSSKAPAQDIDPKEAIVGEWVVDSEHLFTAISNEPDEQRKQMMMGVGMMVAKSVWEIRENGDLVSGGATEPLRLLFEVDDAGLLWMKPVKESGMRFNGIRFDDRDRFIMTANPDDAVPTDLAFVRLFPAGMLKRGKVNPDAEKAITGHWQLDMDRLEQMPWIQSIPDPVLRNRLIDSYKRKAESFSLGFAHGVLFSITDRSDEPLQIGNYLIRAADERTLALSFPFESVSGEIPFLVRIEIQDDDHIELWLTAMGMGPVPLIRSDDVTLP